MYIEMKCDLRNANNCLDLPSLTEIQCQGNGDFILEYIGHVILESMIWFNLIWFEWIDIPNLTESNIYYGWDSFYYTADLQARSTFHFHSFHISIFPFLRFRCSCSRKCHSKYAKTMGLILLFRFVKLKANHISFIRWNYFISYDLFFTDSYFKQFNELSL